MLLYGLTCDILFLIILSLSAFVIFAWDPLDRNISKVISFLRKFEMVNCIYEYKECQKDKGSVNLIWP